MRTSTRTGAAELSRHALGICKRNEIDVKAHSSGGRAWRRRRLVKFRPIKSDATYAIAMHEIGHVLGPQMRGRLNREVMAWQWARACALRWSPSMSAVMQRSLGSYVVWALKRQHRERGRPIVPDPTFVLWSLIVWPDRREIDENRPK